MSDHADVDLATTGLEPRDLEILAFERQWFRYQGAKESAVLEKFGMTLTRYAQVVNAIIDRPAALEVDPMTVRRLLRLRDLRREQRSARRRA